MPIIIKKANATKVIGGGCLGQGTAHLSNEVTSGKAYLLAWHHFPSSATLGMEAILTSLCGLSAFDLRSRFPLSRPPSSLAWTRKDGLMVYAMRVQ